jgi:hypothetical protein
MFKLATPLINVFLAFFLLFQIIYFNINYWITADAPVYLSYARDISEGHILYKNLICSYTPLVIYINSFFFSLFEFNYQYFIVFQYFIIFLSSFFLFRLAINLGKNLNDSIFITLLFLLTVFCCDGTAFILEPYLLLFSFCSILCIYKEKYFLSGIFIALSFLSKQYGLIYFPVFLILLYYEKKLNIKSFINYSLGFFIPQIIFLLFIVSYTGVSAESLISQLLGKQYDFDSSTFEVGLLQYFLGGKVLISLIIIYFFSVKIKKDYYILFIMLFLTLIPTFIKTYQHYFLIAFPIFFLIWLKGELKKLRLFNYLVISFMILINSFLLINRINNYRHLKHVQISKSKEALKQYSEGSDVLIEGHIYLYLMNNYKNPLIGKYGYQFSYKMISEAEKNKFKRLIIN